MKQAYFFLCSFFFFHFCLAQCSVSVNDTLLCTPGDPIQITPTLTSYCKTLNYELNTIPFQEYTLVQANTLNMADDNVVGPFSIGFDFKFFGNTYNQFYIGSNGWISFSPNQTISFLPKPLPSNDNVPLNSIMGPWEDWNPSQGGVIAFGNVGQYPNRKLIVDFSQLPNFICGTSASILGDFQIILNENDFSIENHIANKYACDTTKSVQGIQNIDGTKAVVINGRNATSWAANNYSYKYLPSNNIYYSWETTTGTLLSTSPNPTFASEESTVLVLNLNDDTGCSSSAQFEITIPNVIEPVIHRVGNQLIADPIGYVYQWFLDGQMLATDTQQTLTISSYGMYTVEITNPLTLCSYMSRVHLYAETVGIIENSENSVVIYPNPTKGELHIILNENNKENLKVILKDIKGNDLNSFSIFSGGSIYINQEPGVYILEIFDQYNSQLVRKITIQ